MSTPLHERLAQYALGALEPDEQAAVEAELDAQPELWDEVASMIEASSMLAAELEPVAPSAAARERLLADLEPKRFFPHVPALAKLLDLAAEKVEQLLGLIDDAKAWEPSPFPGIDLIHFEGGPNVLAPDTGFVRFPAGFPFPKHKHHGPEIVYVLQGSLHDSDGHVYVPGEACPKTVDDIHSFTVGTECDAVIVVVQVSFEIVAD